ncbi:MAG: Hpt domain-containing protein [Magnetococcus sp. YQC-5]
MRTHQPKKSNFLDLNKLAEMQKDLGDHFPTVMQIFQSGLMARTERISHAIKEHNLEQMTMESHSLKSICRQIGLYWMGELAAKLESIGESGKTQGAESLVSQLISTGALSNLELTKYCSPVNKPRPFFEKHIIAPLPK